MALMPNDLNQAEFVRNVFAITLPPNTKFEELKNPAFWSHVSAKFHPTDRIEVLDAENTYFAELFVVACARNWARISVLRFVELAEAKAEANGAAAELAEAKKGLGEFETLDHYVDWTQSSQARVVRRADKQVIKDKFPKKTDAMKWLVAHEAGLLV